MSEIKTRAEAREASIEKWADILERIERIQLDAETMCGFCDLAKGKAGEIHIFRCKLCEPDVRKLCDEYITEERLITDPLFEAYQKTNTLLDKIRSLPVDLK